MLRTKLISGAAAVLLTLAMFGAADAHHSFAEYDMSQFMLIEGRITAWRLQNPHSSMQVEAVDENGEMQTWTFQGAGRQWALDHGVRDGSLRRGDTVKVVMNRVRSGERKGAMCFGIKTDGSTLPLNDGTCNAAAIIEVWESNGWLDSTGHLQIRPARP